MDLEKHFTWIIHPQSFKPPYSLQIIREDFSTSLPKELLVFIKEADIIQKGHYLFKGKQADLFLKEASLFSSFIWKEKTLVPTFFSPAEFIVEADPSGNFIAFIRKRDWEVDSIDLPGFFYTDKPYTIFKGTLLPIKTDLDKNLFLDILQKRESGILTSNQLIQLGIELGIKQVKTPSLKEELPTPVLRFKDKNLLYADLFLNSKDREENFYGEKALSSLWKKEGEFWEKYLLENGFERLCDPDPIFYLSTKNRDIVLKEFYNNGWKIKIQEKELLHVEKMQTILSENGIEKCIFFLSKDKCIEVKDFLFLPVTTPLIETENGYIFTQDKQISGVLSAIKTGSSSNHVPLKECPLCFFSPEQLPTTVSFVLNENWKTLLRPYQKEGVIFLKNRLEQYKGALLADVVGLGKTYQALSVLDAFPGKHLIVLPVSLIPQWEREIKKVLPNTFFTIFHGKERSLNSSAKIVLTSYALLRSEELLQKENWNCIVFDEFHILNNSKSQVYQKALSLKSQCRLGMTGTPVINRLKELSDLGGILFKKKDSSALFNSKEQMKFFTLRRTHEEVGNQLPPLVENLVYLEMSEKQKDLYTTYLSKEKNVLLKDLEKEGIEKNHFKILELLLRLRQISCDARLIEPSFEELSAKTVRVLEILEESDEKFCIFSQFTSFLDILYKECKKKNILSFQIDGRVKNRLETIENFENTSDARALFISLKAGGIGLNLQKTSHMLILDPWWNQAIEDQAMGRLHRLGQKNTVFCQKLVCIGTIEEKILELQKHKKQLHKDWIETKISPWDSIDDIAFLLS